MNDCAECQRLWNEHGDAMERHVKLLVDYQVALRKDDRPKIAELAKLVACAAEMRTSARVQIAEHERTAHNSLLHNGI